MPRWHYFETQREHHENSWWRAERQYRRFAVTRAEAAATAYGARLRDLTPHAGYVTTKHSRDGKLYVCGEKTAGAIPAWVWTGDRA